MAQRLVLDDVPERTGKPAIVVSGLTKEFTIPHQRRTTLFENIRGAFQHSTYEKLTTLKNVSFAVERGESIGVIGNNGSGKSTLLKLIANILRPTAGSIEVNGRITPFLELGVGFQDDLTARENIEIYSTIMGLTDREIKKNLDSVLEFAGLVKFRDTRLKNFSSGMQVRLAFATATQRVPDILLIDEVLAVGDRDFQKKCLDVFRQYREQGVTMLYVSHDLSSIRKFCDKTLLLRKGEAYQFGETGRIVDQYIYTAKPRDANVRYAGSGQALAPAGDAGGDRLARELSPGGNKKVAITALEFIDKRGAVCPDFVTGDPVTIRVHYEVREEIDGVDFSLIVYSDAGIYCYATDTKAKKFAVDRTVGRRTLDFIVDRIPMLDGIYYVTLAASAPSGAFFDWREKEHSFYVHQESPDHGLFQIAGRWAQADAGKLASRGPGDADVPVQKYPTLEQEKV